MSLRILRELQAAHAFDPSPIRLDLGAYHVPFGQLAPGTSPEERLIGAAGRGERVAIVGRSGCGKSSLIQHVLGPAVPEIAPILVPVFGEPATIVTSVQAVAGLIIQTLVDHADLDDRARTQALGSASTRRIVPSTTRISGLTLGGGWMNVGIQADLKRQVPPGTDLPRTAQATLEVVHQLLATIQRDRLMPVLVFDDTDRWLRNVGGTVSPQDLALAFFGRVLPELRQLPTGVVVAVHTNYLKDPQLANHLRASVETLIEIPELASEEALGKVIHSRIVTHTSPDDPAAAAPLRAVIGPSAVSHLHKRYQNELRGDLRDVLRTVHVAVTDACNGGFDTVTPDLIEQAAW